MLTSSVIDIPRPLIDPITSLVEALSIVSLALPRPRRDSTTVLVLDNQRRGIHLFRTAAINSQTMHNIVRECSQVPSVDAIVMTSIRTTRLISMNDDEVLINSTTTLSAAGIHLIDWAVIGIGGLYCPRTIMNLPDPWPYGSTCV
jgi:hypothetical protein